MFISIPTLHLLAQGISHNGFVRQAPESGKDQRYIRSGTLFKSQIVRSNSPKPEPQLHDVWPQMHQNWANVHENWANVHQNRKLELGTEERCIKKWVLVHQKRRRIRIRIRIHLLARRNLLYT